MNFKDLRSKLLAYSQSQTFIIMGVIFLVLLAILGPMIYDTYMKRKVVSQLQIVYSKLIQADRIYAMASFADTGFYDISMPIDKFAELYFVPYLPITTYCKDAKSQEKCWGKPQFRNMRGEPINNLIEYSVALDNNAVVGFSKNKNNQILLIVDIDGKAGANRLGRDVFVFYVYNKMMVSKLCPESVYAYSIQNGLHKGAFDKCGLPQDLKTYQELIDPSLEDSCNKKALKSAGGLGAGAGCLALIYKASWVIDDFYPW